MSDEDSPVVLVVEDDPDVSETYELWLGDEYDVRVAESGSRALELVDDAVDVVLLDRMMPRMSGDEVLETVRERGLDCRVAMVTAVDADFDIVTMGFDEYVQKPMTKAELHRTVEELLDRSEYSETIREYQALLAKREALREERSDEELRESERFAELQRRIDRTRERLDAGSDRLVDDAAFVDLLRDLTGDENGGDDLR
jgi:DNA-binding response OmpR family regulator